MGWHSGCFCTDATGLKIHKNKKDIIGLTEALFV